VDLHVPFSALGGGGHPHAASVTVKVPSSAAASAVFDGILGCVTGGLPPPVLAGAFMTRAVVSVEPSASMATAAIVMHESGHSGLPVVDADGRLRGMLSRSDVRRAAAEDAAAKARAAAAAAAAAADVAAAASTAAAAAAAASNGDGSVDVGEAPHNGATADDNDAAVTAAAAAAAAAAATTNHHLVGAGSSHGGGHAHAVGLARPVSAWMRAQLVFVTPDTPLHEVQEIMVDRNVGRVPVLGGGDGKSLVGIISGTDVLKQLRLWEN